MRRVGFHAGRIVTEGIRSLSPSTHYFISERTQGAMQALRGMDWTETASRTAGPRSLSKTEIAFGLHQAFLEQGRDSV